MERKKLTCTLRKIIKPKYCGAVIVAAGTASRMGGVDKIMAPVGGEPLIVHTVRNFQQCDAIREIVVVTREDLLMPVMELCREFTKLSVVVVGGDSREASVLMGLSALSEKCRLVAVQDGARPFASVQLIDRVVRTAHTYGAAIPAIPVKDTVKVAGDGVVDHTPDRSALRAVQTPQVFDTDILYSALVQAKRNGAKLTDDCSAVEQLGMKVKLVDGDERNIKITTPLDLKFAQLIWEEMQ